MTTLHTNALTGMHGYSVPCDYAGCERGLVNGGICPKCDGFAHVFVPDPKTRPSRSWILNGAMTLVLLCLLGLLSYVATGYYLEFVKTAVRP